MNQDQSGSAGAGAAVVPVTSALEPGEDVPSPCINVCKIEAASGLCAGCQRNLEEIASWSGYSAAQKRALLARLPSRKRAQ